MYTHVHIYEHTHTHTDQRPAYSRTHHGFPQCCSRGQWVFWGKDCLISWVWDTPHPLSCRVTVFPRDRFSEESFLHVFARGSRPCGPWGLWGRCPGARTPAMHSTGAAWAPPPFSRDDVKLTAPRGLSVGDAAGEKPFLPPWDAGWVQTRAECSPPWLWLWPFSPCS